MKENAEVLDPTPAMPQVKAWSMRPRDKANEIGPNFKFGPKMQIQRLSDNIMAQTSNLFSNVDIKTRHIDS